MKEMEAKGGSFVEPAHRYAVQCCNLWYTFLDEESRRLFASASLNKMKGHNSEPDSLLGTLSELLEASSEVQKQCQL